MRTPAANPALRGKTLRHLCLADGTYETVGIDSLGRPCSLLTGTPYEVTLRDHGATLPARVVERYRSVLAVAAAEQ